MMSIAICFEFTQNCVEMCVAQSGGLEQFVYWFLSCELTVRMRSEVKGERVLLNANRKLNKATVNQKGTNKYSNNMCHNVHVIMSSRGAGAAHAQFARGVKHQAYKQRQSRCAAFCIAAMARQWQSTMAVGLAGSTTRHANSLLGHSISLCL